MKRTFERILFLIIGAFIASLAYMVGNFDRGVNAHEDSKKQLKCDYLQVNEAILIGKPNIDTSILLQVKENDAQLVLKHGKDAENFDSRIAIIANSKAAMLLIDGKDSNNPDYGITIGVAKDDVLGTASSISLKNKNNTHRITSSGSE
ncbi:hypothetical protein C6501_11170 [Candidatus Poribacteria bacterium]|nr:MAG: hypothetical protein C6501_11170 [Candidatus Poribacteria bacterium]